MSHPSVLEILSAMSGDAASPEIEAHLATCAACRSIGGLHAPLREVSQATDGSLVVPTIDRAMYTGWEEISDGRGGMGRTFRAWDRRLGRVVAVKELLEPAALPDPAARALLHRRFEREARLTARLEHPAIIGVHEAGRWPDGEPFYAMRLVRGTPLDDAIAARRTPAERLALLPSVAVVAEAVAYAHDQGIVHRDIKPANVLLGQFGETVLIDWGLAKDLRAQDDEAPAGAYRSVRDGLTQLGFGTPHYMPPEQARGEDPTFAMDVYALGATLYHVLAGEPPYGAGGADETRARLLAGPPPPITELAPDVPAELHDLVAKAMARDPAQRFRSALELAEELRRFQTGQLTRTRRHTAGELLRHWARRHRAVLRVAALAVVSLAVMAVLSVRRIVEEKHRAEENERRAKRELSRALGQTASQLAPQAARRLEAAVLGVKAVGQALHAGDVPAPEAVQGLVDALAAGPLLAPLHGHRGTVRAFDLSPDRTTLYTAGSDHTVRLWDPRSGSLRATLTSSLPMVDFVRASPRGDRVVVWGTDQDAELWDPAKATSMRLPARDVVAGAAFMPSGREVVIADTVAVTAWDVETGSALRRLDLQHPASALSSPSGTRIAIGCADGVTILWDARSGTETRLTRGNAEIRQASLASDGRSLVTADAAGRFLLWDLGAEPPRATVLQDDPTAPSMLSAATSPDDGRIALLTPRGTLVFDLRQPGERVRLRGGVGWAFSADGQRLYASTEEGSLRAWDPANGRELLRLDGPSDAGEATQFFAGVTGDPRIATAGKNGEAYLWDARTGGETGVLVGHTGEIVAAHASASGERIVTAGLDGTARIWDLAAGHAVTVDEAGSELLDASFSPDEARVLTAGVDGRARVFDASGHELLALGAPGAPASAAAFSPDGGRVLLARLDGTAIIADATAGRVLALLDADPRAGGVTAAAWAPDGRTVVAGYADRSVRLWDASSAEEIATLANDDPEDRGGVTSVSFSPDGEHVLVGLGAGTSFLCSARDLAPVRDLDGRPASATASPFSSDGRLAVTVGGDGRVLVHDLQLGTSVALEGHTRLVLSATFSRDGARLVTAGIDGTLRLWDLARAASLLEIRSAGQGEATWAELSPDGRWIVATYASGAIRLHPATAGSAMARACDALAYFGRAAEVATDCP